MLIIATHCFSINYLATAPIDRSGAADGTMLYNKLFATFITDSGWGVKRSAILGMDQETTVP